MIFDGVAPVSRSFAKVPLKVEGSQRCDPPTFHSERTATLFLPSSPKSAARQYWFRKTKQHGAVMNKEWRHQRRWRRDRLINQECHLVVDSGLDLSFAELLERVQCHAVFSMRVPDSSYRQRLGRRRRRWPATQSWHIILVGFLVFFFFYPGDVFEPLQLRAVETNLVAVSECARSAEYAPFVSDANICAQRDGRDACKVKKKKKTPKK